MYQAAPTSITRGLSIMIYADPGKGKTSLACTLPVDETLFVVTEAGMGPLLGKGFRYFDVLATMKLNPLMSLEEIIQEFYKEIRTNPKFPFKYIVIDNLSELESQLLSDYTRRRKKPFPEAKEYGDVSFRIHEWVVLFRDLQYQGITVIFNVWEKQMELKSMTGESYTMAYPYLSGRNAAAIPGIVDAVGHLYTKGEARFVEFSQNNMCITKCQFNGLAKEEANLMTILGKIRSYNYGEHIEIK
jgi:phage nucleotide-binding protein